MGLVGFVFFLFVTQLISYGNARSVVHKLFELPEAAVLKKAAVLDNAAYDWFGPKYPAYPDDVIPDLHQEEIERSNNILKSGWMMVESMKREASKNNPDLLKVLQFSDLMTKFNTMSEFAESIFYSHLDRLIPSIDVCPGDTVFASREEEIHLKIYCFISITSNILEKLEYFYNNKYSDMITLEDIGTMVSLDKKWITLNDQLYNLIKENQTMDCNKTQIPSIDLLDMYLKNNPIKSYHNILHQNTAPQNEINHYHHVVPFSHHGSRRHLMRNFHHMLDLNQNRHGNYKQKYSTDYENYGPGQNYFEPDHDVHGYGRGYDSANHQSPNEHLSGRGYNNYHFGDSGPKISSNNYEYKYDGKSKAQGSGSSHRYNKNNVHRPGYFRRNGFKSMAASPNNSPYDGNWDVSNGNNNKNTNPSSNLYQENDQWNRDGEFDQNGYDTDDYPEYEILDEDDNNSENEDYYMNNYSNGNDMEDGNYEM